MRLKILHWPTGYPDPEYGTPYHLIFIAEHVRAASLYHDSAVLYHAPPATLARLTHVSRSAENGAQVIRIRHRKLAWHGANRLVTYLLIGRELARLVGSGFRPDLIHIHIFAGARMALGVARALGVPVVVTEHWSALCRPGALRPERLAFAGSVYERAAIVLPVCDYLRRHMESIGARFRYRIVPNAVDPAVFRWEEQLPRDGSLRRVLTVARLEEPKDIPGLLKAVAILSHAGVPVRLDVVGRGNPVPYVSLAETLGIGSNVTFHGELPKARIAAMLRMADVFALASRWENSPCVIGEALCCGTPVVATAVGGVPELLPPDAGRLVAAGDPEALADALADVLARGASFDRQAIAAEAQGRFGYQSVGRQLHEVYQEVVGL